MPSRSLTFVQIDPTISFFQRLPRTDPSPRDIPRTAVAPPFRCRFTASLQVPKEVFFRQDALCCLLRRADSAPRRRLHVAVFRELTAPWSSTPCTDQCVASEQGERRHLQQRTPLAEAHRSRTVRVDKLLLALNATEGGA